MPITMEKSHPSEHPDVEAVASKLALEGFKGEFGHKEDAFPSDPIWAEFRKLGSMLWLDTGDYDAASKLWKKEFTHLTTNNTLVNQEVQKGQFDQLIGEAAGHLREADPSIHVDQLVTELGFILNCRVALRLIEAFDAHVSVELHPSVAHRVEETIRLARRYYAVCPDRFIVKVPLTPAGYLSVRQLASEGMPINYTLGFSARQNYLAAVISKPQYVNVFMGRLNAFVSDNGLGDGKYVGEKVTLATQEALWKLRGGPNGKGTHLIGASTREAQQVIDLAGMDVFTLPPKVASTLHDQLQKSPQKLATCANHEFEVKMGTGHTAEEVGLSQLWEVTDGFAATATKLAGDTDALASPDALVKFLRTNGENDLFRSWTDGDLHQLLEDGKIPKLDRWKDDLKSGKLGLDDLLSNSALQSFTKDQKELDDRIRRLVQESDTGS